MLYILIVKRFELYTDFALYKINILYYYIIVISPANPIYKYYKMTLPNFMDHTLGVGSNISGVYSIKKREREMSTSS